MTILDRYVLKKFLVPFFYCCFGFIAIWLVFNLSDNGPDFIEGRASLGFILQFYRSQLPQVLVLTLPIGLLLALLYSLTQMSRSNEIIAMLTAGRSVVRILMPLFVVGLLIVGVVTALNYEGAPHAEKTRKAMLKEINSGKKREPTITGHMFRNREDRRTWYMRKLHLERPVIDDVQIIQQSPSGSIVRQFYARDAVYDEANKTWVFEDAKIVDTNPDGDITRTRFLPELRISRWSETPWRIASSAMNPDYLSVPELEDYLKFNADFPPQRLAPFQTQLHNRWALPWSALIVVLIAAPLGIVYSRRGILGGVALAIALFFGLVMANNLFIALGKGARISPMVAGWAPFVFFALVGLILVWMRSTNREIRVPKIFG